MESGGSFLLHISMFLQKHFPQGSNQIQGTCAYQRGFFWIACLLCQILGPFQGLCWLWYSFLGLRYHIWQQLLWLCCPLGIWRSHNYHILWPQKIFQHEFIILVLQDTQKENSFAMREVIIKTLPQGLDTCRIVEIGRASCRERV